MVEQIDERTPKLRLVPPFALVPESINLCYILALVISSQHMDFFRVLYLEGEKEAKGLYALLPSIHVVAQEKVTGLRRRPCIIHKAQEIVVLAVYVSSDR